MNTHKKMLLVVALMLITLMVATIINVGLNFREYAYKNSIEKSKLIAKIVRDGLTAHMVNGIMDKRESFISNLSNVKDMEELWIVRSNKVSKQFGPGYKNEHIRDAIDKKVLSTGKLVEHLDESSTSATLRVTVPFIASSYEKPNCLQCHQVPEGTVLGAVSMKLDISKTREAGGMTILKILAINLLFILIALYVTNRYIKPFMELFEELRHAIQKAQMGNFSYRIKNINCSEGKDVAENLNELFEKMRATFFELKQNLTTFVSKSNLSCSDPLNEAKNIIHELADVYKFKNTIELDPNRHALYQRIIYVLKNKFEIKHFALYEVDKVTNKRNIIHITEGESFCLSESEDNAMLCRAHRTATSVISTEFPNMCESCTRQDLAYHCIPFTINEDSELILSLSAKEGEILEDYTKIIASIKNYFEAAKPAIESRILMDKLRESSLRDGMTGLYNRRFLEEYIDTTMAQALRSNVKYSVLMLDIDFFKMVNDTYGHDVGDTIIKGLSEILENEIRESDMAIRYGGEEFIILLYNATPESAHTIAENIRTKFQAKKFPVNATETINKTISIGIAHLPEDADTIWKVIKFADTALYEAKNGGRNQVVDFKAAMFEGESF